MDNDQRRKEFDESFGDPDHIINLHPEMAEAYQEQLASDAAVFDKYLDVRAYLRRPFPVEITECELRGVRPGELIVVVQLPDGSIASSWCPRYVSNFYPDQQIGILSDEEAEPFIQEVTDAINSGKPTLQLRCKT